MSESFFFFNKKKKAEGFSNPSMTQVFHNDSRENYKDKVEVITHAPAY